MESEGVKPTKSLPRSALLMRGESAVASVGLALAVILLAALAGCGYWLIHMQQSALVEARQRQVAAVGELLGGAIEHLLTAGRITPARRMLMDAADRHELSRCRVVLPDGNILADAQASLITAGLESPWRGHVEQIPTRQIDNGTLSLAYPIRVAGRGEARLEIAAPLTPAGHTLWEAQAGVGLVGVTAMVALLLVYRHFRARLAAMGVIREALLAAQHGETATAALAVSGDLGDEAAAWNRILNEQHALRQRAMLKQACETHGAASGGGELASGCDAVSHGLMLVDEQGAITYANHAAGVFLQTNRDALISRRVESVLPDASLAQMITEAASGKLRRRATREVARGEQESAGVLRYSAHPVRRGESSTAMIVIEDVTQQRVAEGARHQFVAQATHELRTPLTNIRLYLETAQDEGEGDPAVRAQCLNVINQETHRLERLVGDMLSVAEIEAGSLQVHNDDVKLDAILRDVQAHYEAQAREKHITFTFKIPPKLPVVQGDRDKLMLAVQNLVGNALKYTPEGGRVTVNVEAGGGQLSVEVNDTGIGIAPDDLPKVFDKFYRAQDKRLAGITGSGLGLALAREVVRLHGGDVTVHSQLDEGSTFTLTLPAQEGNDTATE